MNTVMGNHVLNHAKWTVGNLNKKVSRVGVTGTIQADTFQAQGQQAFGVRPVQKAIGVLAALFLMITNFNVFDGGDRLNSTENLEKISTVSQDSTDLSRVVLSGAYDPQYKAKNMVNRLFESSFNKKTQTLTLNVQALEEVPFYVRNILFKKKGLERVASELEKGGFDEKAAAVRDVFEAGKHSIEKGTPLAEEAYKEAVQIAAFQFNSFTDRH